MRHTTLSRHQGVAGLLKHEKIRFALVGAVNTVVDFSIFLTLSVVFGFSASIANVISTSCALALSYMLNKKAVFGDADPSNRRQVLLFIGVTLAGLWVIQSIIIAVMSSVLQALLPQLPLPATLAIAKIFATVASLIWNYIWYSRVVFRKGQK